MFEQMYLALCCIELKFNRNVIREFAWAWSTRGPVKPDLAVAQMNFDPWLCSTITVQNGTFTIMFMAFVSWDLVTGHCLAGYINCGLHVTHNVLLIGHTNEVKLHSAPDNVLLGREIKLKNTICLNSLSSTSLQKYSCMFVNHLLSICLNFNTYYLCLDSVLSQVVACNLNTFVLIL